MANKYQALGYIMAANAEALGYFFAAWWGGGWLNDHMDAVDNWYPITFTCALILISISWYRMFRNLTRMKDES